MGQGPDGGMGVGPPQTRPPEFTPPIPVPPEEPTGEQLTGGRGDNLVETVQKERTGTTEGSSTLQPRNRMMAENQRDIDAESDTSSTQVGNAYGVSVEAAENFAAEIRNRAKLAHIEADRLDNEADEWEAKAYELSKGKESDEDT